MITLEDVRFGHMIDVLGGYSLKQRTSIPPRPFSDWLVVLELRPLFRGSGMALRISPRGLSILPIHHIYGIFSYR